MKASVTVKAPASTANMGPGFDCIGMALDIWNSVRVDVGPPGFEVVGHGADSLPRGRDNLVFRSFRMLFAEVGQSVPSVSITCCNEVPLTSGLGSSSAALIAGLMAGNEICGRPMDAAGLLELAARTEGHPDNVAPALLGGFQIGVQREGQWLTSSVPIPEGLRAVVFVPEAQVSTDEARGILSPEVSRRDAVYNIGRVALLVRAFSTGDLKDLAAATEDRLHQPAREAMVPGMKNIFRAAMSAGALGVFLSGSGPSVLALTRGRELTVSYEMADAASKSGIEGTMTVTRPTERGAHVVQTA